MDPYGYFVSLVTSETTEVDFIVADCNCVPQEPYVLEGRPEYFTKARAAARAWVHHATYRTLYWGVHYRGRHVIHVRNRYGLTCLGGPVRFTPGPEKE